MGRSRSALGSIARTGSGLYDSALNYSSKPFSQEPLYVSEEKSSMDTYLSHYSSPPPYLEQPFWVHVGAR